MGSALIALLTIVPDEFEAARTVFDVSTPLPGTAYFSTDPPGTFEHQVVLRRAFGRGNVPAQQAASDILEDFKPRFLILIGVAGGVGGRDDVGLGDVVVPDYIHYGEMQKLVGGQALSRYLPYDHPSMYLHERHVHAGVYGAAWDGSISDRRPLVGNPRVLTGSLVAGEKVWGDPSNVEQAKMLEHFNDSVAVDMESMGVARAVFSGRRDLNHNAQYLIVRGISDLVGDESNNDTRKQWRSYAAFAAATFALVVVRPLLALPGTTL